MKDFKKGREKKKKEKSDKTHVKIYLYEKMTAKKSTKTGKNFGKLLGNGRPFFKAGFEEADELSGFP